MSILARPTVAAFAAKTFRGAVYLAVRSGKAGPSPYDRLTEFAATSHEITIPTSVAPARAVVYLPVTTGGAAPAVHVNFHGGGYVLPFIDLDDPLCGFLAAEAGVVVVNVDYVVAPQHPFPAPTRQAYEIVQWVAANGAEQGWDGSRPRSVARAPAVLWRRPWRGKHSSRTAPRSRCRCSTTRRSTWRPAPRTSTPPPQSPTAPWIAQSSTARRSRAAGRLDALVSHPDPGQHSRPSAASRRRWSSPRRWTSCTPRAWRRRTLRLGEADALVRASRRGRTPITGSTPRTIPRHVGSLR